MLKLKLLEPLGDCTFLSARIRYELKLTIIIVSISIPEQLEGLVNTGTADCQRQSLSAPLPPPRLSSQVFNLNLNLSIPRVQKVSLFPHM